MLRKVVTTMRTTKRSAPLRSASLFLILLCGACTKAPGLAGEWKSTQIGEKGNFKPARAGRETTYTFSADGKGTQVLNTIKGPKTFPVTWKLDKDTVTIQMEGKPFETGSVGAEGKSMETTDSGGTQVKWVRTT